jgi:hypothetical protein
MLRNPALFALLLLTACATAAPPPPRRDAPPPPPPPGLARLYGRDAAAVLAMLGPASLDRSEGPARQLQFVRPPCVLDVYLYPVSGQLAGTGRPVVTGAAARKPDGSRIEPGACLTLLLP